MSYILDALKKLEKEKARKNSGGGMISNAGDLMGGYPGRGRQRSTWPRMFFLVLVVSLLTSGATWLVMNAISKRKVAVSPAPTVSAENTQKKAANSSQQSSTAPPAQTAPKLVSIPAPPPVTTVQTKTPAAPPQKTAPTASLPARGGTEPGAGVAVSPPADIKVAGIAWQDERSARRAVVNGYLLQEGSVVAGAKIVEIQPERVRFSGPTGTFDVPLLSSGMAGGSR